MVGCSSHSGVRYRLALLFSILLLGGCLGNEPPVRAQPNILLILTDDLGNNDIGSWGDGSAPTPTLDRLSQSAVRFRHHYTDSTCSPSRAALLTGRSAVEVGFQANGLGLSSDLPSLPKSLKALGYRTAHIGKWHVGEALEYVEIQPGNQGFDYWLGFLNHFVLRGPGPGGEILQRQPTHIDPWLQEDGRAPRQYKGYLDDLLVDKAIELITRSGNDPWFINLWLYSPHTPYQPSPEFKAQFPDTPEGHYLAVLKQLDHNVERLLAALKQQGLEKDTVVVFTSDNGGTNLTRDNNFPLVGKKATYLEGGVRSPLLIRWPGHLDNTDFDAVTDITDLYPTLLALAGGSKSDGLSGRDLAPALGGEKLQEREALYWASDVGLLGMSYGGALFEEARHFYRGTFGDISTVAVTPAVGQHPVSALDPLPLVAGQAAEKIVRWERRVRQVEVSWHPAVDGRPGYLTGRDFQRAPVFSGYSLGIDLGMPASGHGEQVIIEQEGVWRVSLDNEQRIRLKHGDVALTSKPIVMRNGCNTLITSFDVQQAYTYPFASPAASRIRFYFNGELVLASQALLTRPQMADKLINPTYIGAMADGALAYRGKLERPVLINKLLLPEQEGYALTDMLSGLCHKEVEH